MADYTPNYGLHQWVPEDQFRRTDFNEDFAKIDTALQDLEDTKADSASVDSRFSLVNSSITSLRNTDATKASTTDVNSRFANVDSRLEQLNTDLSAALTARPEVVMGTYIGDGADYRTISLGFTPKAVLLEYQKGFREFADGIVVGGLALQNQGNSAFQIVEGGFQVRFRSGYISSNSNGSVYLYLAFK